MDNTKTRHPITIRFTDLQKAHITEQAKLRGGISANAYIRMLVQEDMKNA